MDTNKTNGPRLTECVYRLMDAPNHVAFTFSTDDAVRLVKPDAFCWSNMAFPLPKIGDRVTVKDMGKGPGEVVGYFVEHGWLGVHVRLDNPIVVNGTTLRAIHAFGIDF